MEKAKKIYDCLKCNEITILGLPFKDINNNYSRIKSTYTEIFNLANNKLNSLGKCAAGVSMTFKTNSSSLAISYTLDRKPHQYHMTNVNEGGFDMYIAIDGKFRLINVTNMPEISTEYESVLFNDLSCEEREILINFPLYSGVEKVSLILDEDAKIIKHSRFDSKKRWLFYGTSITQGGCSSRSGMCYTNILSRHYNKEIINLGFSGNGLGEPCVAEMINEIADLETVFIDYDANAASGNTLFETLEPFINILRKNNKELKIVIISRVPNINTWRRAGRKELYDKVREYERSIVEAERQKGDKNIFFIDGSKLFSAEEYDEYTVDGVHFTDLGYMQFSKNIIPFIDEIKDAK